MLGTIIQYIPSKILCETIKTQNMLPLKEAIAEKHSLAEKMTFNQRMFNGELSKEEYILYLCHIHHWIELAKYLKILKN
jgi:heme oxygenase